MGCWAWVLLANIFTAKWQAWVEWQATGNAKFVAGTWEGAICPFAMLHEIPNANHLPVTTQTTPDLPKQPPNIPNGLGNRYVIRVGGWASP